MSLTDLSGSIVYTRRAFHQDAVESMGGDIVKGLIELITNSDDAYASIDSSPGKKKIVIEVEHRRVQPWLIRVKDRATGMSPQTMVDKITQLGGRTSGFEKGEDRRGNLGRGAKDLAAFGTVTFKSIHEHVFGELVLQSDGNWDVTADRKSTKEDRKNLGIPRGNGTIVEILCEPNIRCHRHDILQKKLSTHYQLRDILSDPNRKVELIKINDGTKDLLTFEYQKLDIVFDDDLKIKGFPDAEAHLTLYRNAKCYDDGPYDPGRPNGILIKGNRAIYENTLFDLENKPYSGWFSGVLVSPTIDKLALEYDNLLEKNDEKPNNNPLPIISRNRTGLNPNHPFYKSLKEAVEKPIRKLITDEEKRARQEIGDIEDNQTKADLNKLAKEVGRLINEELRDIDAEELPPDTETGETPYISIIPEEVYAYMGENRTLTLAVRVDKASEEDKASIELDPEGVVNLLTPTVKIHPHNRRDDLLVGQIRLRPIIEGEATIITATINGLNANAIVTVKPPPEIVEEEVEQPDALMFERPSYRIGWRKNKNIRIFAPAQAVADYGEDLRVFSADPGIVVRNQSIKLKYDDSLDFYTTYVRVDARTLNASCEITARLNGQVATTQVKVTKKELGYGVNIRLVDESFGSWRAISEKETQPSGEESLIIKIAGRHPGIRPFLGEDRHRQNSPIIRSIMAEAVADVAARMVVQELFQLRRTAEQFDADRFYSEHNKRIKRFLPRFQRILVGDPNKIVESSINQIPIIEN